MGIARKLTLLGHVKGNVAGTGGDLGEQEIDCELLKSNTRRDVLGVV